MVFIQDRSPPQGLSTLSFLDGERLRDAKSGCQRVRSPGALVRLFKGRNSGSQPPQKSQGTGNRNITLKSGEVGDTEDEDK